MKNQKTKERLALVLMRVGLAAILALSLVFTLSLAASAETVTDEGVAEDEAGFLDSAFALLSERLPLLLSALTLLGTTLLARLFRSSLVPIIEGGMKRVGGGVEQLEEKTRELLKKNEDQLESLSLLVSRLAQAGQGESERADALLRTLDAAMSEIKEDLCLESARLDAVLLMLKEVFTAARLPAASKLALEEIYLETSKMKGRVDKKQGREEGSA